MKDGLLSAASRLWQMLTHQFREEGTILVCRCVVGSVRTARGVGGLNQSLLRMNMAEIQENKLHL